MLAVSAPIEKEELFRHENTSTKTTRTSEKACEYLGNHHCNSHPIGFTLSEERRAL